VGTSGGLGGVGGAMVVIGAKGVAGGACVDIGEACCDAP
jgi:hypothetical protein